MPPSSKRRSAPSTGIVDLDVTLEQDIPEYRLNIDRERAVDTGLMTANIVRTVGALVGGKAVSTYEDQDGDAVNLRVRLPQDLRQDPDQVKQLRLPFRNWASPRLGPPGGPGFLSKKHQPFGDQPAGPFPGSGPLGQPGQTASRLGHGQDQGGHERLENGPGL